MNLHNKLSSIAGVSIYPGDFLDSFENLKLPLDYIDFLRQSNGLMVFHGYFRLFGFRNPSTLCLTNWNQYDLWKFAWQNRALGDFFCFGETAWGDQYAFKLNEGKKSKVYLLDGVMMESEVIAESFNEFFTSEILRCAVSPYDEMDLLAFKKIGPLNWFEHLIHVPSILISGSEDIHAVNKIEAVAGMVINGDIATQCGDEPTARQIDFLETYTDCNSRARVRVIWRG